MIRVLFITGMITAGIVTAALTTGEDGLEAKTAQADPHHGPSAHPQMKANPVPPGSHGPSMEEVAANYFVLMDINRDGKLTLEERQNIPNHERLKPFAELDLDSNGEVDFEEYVTSLRQRVDRQPGVDI